MRPGVAAGVPADDGEGVATGVPAAGGEGVVAGLLTGVATGVPADGERVALGVAAVVGVGGRVGSGPGTSCSLVLGLGEALPVKKTASSK